MTTPVSKRRTPATQPLALVSALSLCFAATAPALAQTADQGLPTIVITGARFASDPGLLPIGATVISADDIRRAGVNDVNQAIRKIGGVYGRQSLDSSPDFSLDLRGFGANSNQNLVVVLDGVRMSENDLGSPMLSSIPIDTVERIEIIRGGSSVLYGDGATGGVINITTKRPGSPSSRGSVRAEVGQFGLRDVRASVAQTWDGFALDAAIGSQRSDNYRANNDFKTQSFSGGAQFNTSGGRVGVRLDSTRQDARFPGALSQKEFDADPRQSNRPNDFGTLDSDRVTAFAEQRVGSVDVAAELSHRERSTDSSFNGFPFVADSKQTQFSPRVRHLATFGPMLNELVAGVDLIRWKRATAFANETQNSKAIYARDEVKWNAAHDARLSIGARHEVFDKEAADPAPFSQTQNAWELQGSYSVLPKVNLFAKAGQSYRVANADENGFRASSFALKGQTSHDLEFGVSVGDAAQKLTARVFRHRLSNEIFFDPTLGFCDPTFGCSGANTNLDPTKRQGLEIDASTRIAPDWRLIGHLQHVKASFTDGPNAGKEMVLVPKNIVTARLSWVPGDRQSADIGVQWVDSQRFGGDFDNTCSARIPSYTTLDARYARKYGAWEVALTGLNLTDKQYYSNAFGCKSGIYPSDGRQMKISARYDF